jgi:phosphonate C-P lyase system protein PhnG
MDESGATVQQLGNLENPGNLKANLLRVIGVARVDEVAGMLDRLWASGSFSVQKAPRTGLVMYTVCDSFDTPFYLGEVLVTIAEVACSGQTGLGTVCGDEPEKALLLAIVEATERSGRSEALDDFRELIARLEKVSAEQRTVSSRVAATTEVRFDSMKKETVEFGTLGG